MKCVDIIVRCNQLQLAWWAEDWLPREVLLCLLVWVTVIPEKHGCIPLVKNVGSGARLLESSLTRFLTRDNLLSLSDLEVLICKMGTVMCKGVPGRVNELRQCLEQGLTRSECPTGGVIVTYCSVLLRTRSLGSATPGLYKHCCKKLAFVFVRCYREAFPRRKWFLACAAHLRTLVTATHGQHKSLHIQGNHSLRTSWRGFLAGCPSRVSRPRFLFISHIHAYITHTLFRWFPKCTEL